jgi:hypothetical protein
MGILPRLFASVVLLSLVVSGGAAQDWTFAAANDTLPADFPTFQVLVNADPAPGMLFMAPFSRAPQIFTYLAILDHNLTPVFHQRRVGGATTFALQPNGLITFYDPNSLCFFAMNAGYVIVDSFQCANGFPVDPHDIVLTTDGHAFLMGYDVRTVDMSRIVPKGNPAATVTGLVLQELDAQKNVVWQWSSWNHFLITDATHEDLTAANIDYVHANAIEVDTDGNILLSSRHLDEITKINTQTGAIMWRMGGRNNMFAFLNDSLRFSHQHDIRRLPNGNITLFDNGNFHSPPVSRAVEYHLDEEVHTAELVWQYRETPDVYAFATGNVQRLQNGNTLISWGTVGRITEVRPDGSKALDMLLSPDFRIYRTMRFPWAATGIHPPEDLPLRARLLPAYPNPFNPSTSLTYEISAAGRVTLKVFDMLGREVATLVDAMEQAGTQRVTFDGAGVATGVYVVRFQAGDIVETAKVLLIR